MSAIRNLAGTYRGHGVGQAHLGHSLCQSFDVEALHLIHRDGPGIPIPNWPPPSRKYLKAGATAIQYQRKESGVWSGKKEKREKIHIYCGSNVVN